jgi:HNH endonuclease
MKHNDTLAPLSEVQTMKMIFFNVAWMDHYCGITEADEPLDGGTWEKKNEVCNFANVGGICYGFVQPPGGNAIAIDRIEGTLNTEIEEGVTVVWTARSRSGGTVIVGFYLNAIVYRHRQRVENSELHSAYGISDYFAKCDVNDAILVPLGKRRHRIPRPKGGGGMGQSLVWYADKDVGAIEKQKVSLLLSELLEEKNSRDQDERIVKNELATVGTFDGAYREIEEDVSEILNSPLSDTEKATLIRARLGQAKFRKSLLALWRNRCAVSGCSIPVMLRASHIKPWRECSNSEERRDADNGLLLSANLDALFDEGLIGFDSQGKMIVSEKISALDAQLLGLGQGLTKCPNDGQAKYLAFHRELHGLQI